MSIKSTGLGVVMLVFHYSTAAGAELKAPEKKAAQSEAALDIPQDAWHWQLHAVRIKRKLVFVVMEQQSRFVMVFWELKKGDVVGLVQQFLERLLFLLGMQCRETGALDEASMQLALQRVVEKCQQIHFTKGTDRSVQAHINEVIMVCRREVESCGCLPDGIAEAAWFDNNQNGFLRTVRGGAYFYPKEALFRSWLHSYSTQSEDDISAAIARNQQLRLEELAMRLNPVLTQSLPDDVNANAAVQAMMAKLMNKAGN
jgi:hypothetical protein